MSLSERVCQMWFSKTSLLVGVVGIIALMGSSCIDNSASVFPLDGELTESVALDLSRSALTRAGLDTNKLEAVEYWTNNQGDEKFFARNRINRNRGHTLWHMRGSANTFDYSVNLERKDTGMHCRVLPVK